MNTTKEQIEYCAVFRAKYNDGLSVYEKYPIEKGPDCTPVFIFVTGSDLPCEPGVVYRIVGRSLRYIRDPRVPDERKYIHFKNKRLGVAFESYEKVGFAEESPAHRGMCQVCGQRHELDEVTKTRKIIVDGVEFTAPVRVNRCNHSGKEFLGKETYREIISTIRDFSDLTKKWVGLLRFVDGNVIAESEICGKKVLMGKTDIYAFKDSLPFTVTKNLMPKTEWYQKGFYVKVGEVGYRLYPTKMCYNTYEYFSREQVKKLPKDRLVQTNQKK